MANKVDSHCIQAIFIPCRYMALYFFLILLNHPRFEGRSHC